MRCVLAVVSLMAALAVPSAVGAPFSCGFSMPCVTVGADGVSPAHVDLSPGQGVWFAGDGDAQVSWDGLSCTDRVRTTFPPPWSYPCLLRDPGRYTFRVGGFSGTAVVHEPEWSTIESSATIVAYGGSVRLSGSAYRYPFWGGPPPLPTRVTLEGSPVIGEATAVRIWADPPSPLPVGVPVRVAWSAYVRPEATTSYAARVDGGRGREVVVAVRPAVALRRAGRLLAVRVEPGRRFGGRRIVLQRQAHDGSWRGVRWLVLRRTGATTVRTRLRRGTVVRVFVPPSPGYESSVSEPVRLR